MQYGKFKLTDESLKALNNEFDAAAARGARANAAVESSRGNTETAKKWTAQADQIDSKTGISSTPTPVRQYVRTGNVLVDTENARRVSAGLDPVYNNPAYMRNQMRLDQGLGISRDVTPVLVQYKNYLEENDKKEKQIEYQLAQLRRRQLELQQAFDEKGDTEAFDESTALLPTMNELSNQLDRIKANNQFAKENTAFTLAAIAGDADLITDYWTAHNNARATGFLGALEPLFTGGRAMPGSKATQNTTAAYDRENELARQLKAKGYTDEQLQDFLNLKNAEAMQSVVKETQEFAKKYPNLSTAASVVTAPVRGALGVAGMVMDPGTRNSPFNVLNEFSSTVQDTVRNDIVTSVTESGAKLFGESEKGKKAAEYLGKGVGFVYSAAVSSVESYLNMNMGGVLGELLMGMNAASSTYYEALNNGLSNFQAMTTAMTSGVFEAVFEHLSLENLRGLKASDGRGMKTLIGNIVKSFITEGSEEVATDLANELWDYYMNGGLSEYERYVDNYIQQYENQRKAEAVMNGTTVTPLTGEEQRQLKEQAEAAYRKKFLKQLGESMIVGGLSGAMHAGVYGARNEIRGAGTDIRTGKALTELGNNAEGGVGEVLAPLTEQMRATAEAELPENANRKQKQQQKQAGKTLSALESINEKTGNRKAGRAVNEALNQFSETQHRVMNEALQDAGMTDKNARNDLINAYENMMFKGIADRDSLKTLREHEDYISVLNELTNAEGIDGVIGLRTDLANAMTKNKKQKSQTAKELNTQEIAQQAETTIKEHKADTLVKTGFKATTADGATVETGAVKGIEDGKLQVVIDKESGATAKLDELTFDDAGGETLEKIQNMMSGDEEYRVKLTTDGANMMLALLNETDVDADTALQDLYNAYAKGSVLGDMDTMMRETGYDISTAAINAMYTAGAANYAVKPGVTRIGSAQLSQNVVDEIAAIDAYAKDNGLNIVVTDELYGEMQDSKGQINTLRMLGQQSGDVIVVSLHSGQRENVLSVTAFHETFHWLGKQGKLGARYQQNMINSIIGYLKSSDKYDYDEIRQQRLDRGYAEDKVDEEIAAQFFGTIMAEEAFRKYAAETDAPLWKKIIDHVKAFLENIRQRIEQRFAGDKAVQAALMSEVEEIQHFVTAFELALADVNEARKNGEITQKEDGTDYSFAGIGSETANRGKLRTAKAMEEDGADSEEIRQETGWFRGYDGKWRYEIDDSKMRVDLSDLEYGEAFLDSVVSFDALFEAYPELKNIKVIPVKMLDGSRGSYDSATNEIELNKDLLDDTTGMRSTLLHEMQHAVQKIEGFARGASVGYWDTAKQNAADSSGELYRRTAGEIEARDVQSRRNLTAAQRKETRPDIDRTDVVFADGGTANALPGNLQVNEFGDAVDYSLEIKDETLLDYLNEQIDNGEYITVYRSMQIINGGLYAPMNAVDRDEKGKNKKLGFRSRLKHWEMATESPAIAQAYMDKNSGAKYAKFDLDGVDNKTNGVAYNPYLHSSNLVLNDQFSAAYRRNLVTVECRVPLSEANGAYHAQYAKDPTGWAQWKAGGVAGKLVKIKPELERRLFLSRYMMPWRVLDDSEVAQMYKEYLSGTDIAVPWNVVTNSLRNELEKAGVKISYADVKTGSNIIRYEDQVKEGKTAKENVTDFSVELDSSGRKLTEGQQAYFADSKIRDKNGNLQVIYHGTEADFYTFDTNVSGGSHGNAEGFGIYLTDDPEVSSKYGERQIKGYANITRPAYGFRKTITQAELAKLIRAACEKEAAQMVEDDEYDSVKDALPDTWVSNYVMTYEYASMRDVYAAVAEQIGRLNGNDADIVYEIMNANGIRDYKAAMAFYRDVLTPATGIDGIWQIWKNEETGQSSNIYLAFDSNQIKDIANENPTEDPDIRWSADLDQAYEEDQKTHDEMVQLRIDISVLEDELKNSAEYKTLKDAIMDKNRERLIKAKEEYNALEQRSGISEKKEQLRAAEDRYEKANIKYKELYKQEATEKERAAVEKSGLTEPEYFTKAAVKQFGYTTNWNETGYLTKEGKMLNFSGEKGQHFGYRTEDHRGINAIFEATDGAEAMNRFMAYGNIRIMAETPGIDISVQTEPTQQQYTKIKDMVRKFASEGFFNVDLTNAEGYNVGALEYEGRISADRVVNDIKHYFETGEIREQSSVEKFRSDWSADLDQEYMDAVEAGDEAKQQKLVEQAARRAGYVLSAYHGTEEEFTTFKRGDEGIHLGTETVANLFGEEGKVLKLYAKIQNPFIMEGDNREWSPYEIASAILAIDEGKTQIESYLRDAVIHLQQKFKLTKAQRELATSIYDDAWSYYNSPYNNWTEKEFEEIMNDNWDAVAVLLNSLGYDGVKYLNEMDGEQSSYSYIALRPSDVKSADPVTYDEDGNVIPLSERFNSEKEDIRLSADLESEAIDLEERIRATDAVAAETLDVMQSILENSVGVADKRLTKKEYRQLADKYLQTREGKDGGLSRAQVDEFARTMERIDSMMTTAENVDTAIFFELYNLMRNDALGAGNYETNDWVKEYRKHFRENGKKITIKIPQDVITDVVENYGGRKGFRDEVFGMFNVSYDDNVGQDLDEFYAELGKEYTLPLENEDGNAVTASDKVRNLIALYRADDKTYRPVKRTEYEAQYDGMSLEEVSADRALDLMTELLLQGRELTKNAKQDAQYLKELREQAGEEHKEIQKEIKARATQAYNNEMIRLMQMNLDSVQYEIEAEKLRMRYQLESVRENYNRAMAAMEEDNAVLNAQRDEGVKQIRAEYETKFEAEKERNRTQMERMQESLKQEYEKRNQKRKELQRQWYQERLQEQQKKKNDQLQKLAEINKARRNMKAITDVFLNEKKNKYLPQALQRDLIDFAKTFFSDRNIMTENAMEKLNYIAKNMLGDGKGAEYENMFGRFDEDTAEALKDLIAAVNKAQAKYKGRRNLTGLMTVEQLQELNDIMTHIRFVIESANSIYINGRRQAMDAVTQTVEEDCAKQKKHNIKFLNSNFFDAVGVKMITPIYMFKERIGGEIGRLYEDMRNGQDEWMWHVRDAYMKLRELQKKYNYKDWKDKKIELHFEETGLRSAWDPTMTVEAAMQIYVTANRQMTNGMESNHLNEGGIILSDESEIKKKYSEWRKANKKNELQGEEAEKSWTEYINNQETAGRHQLTVGEMLDVGKSLPEEARKYADECVEYLSTVCSAWGNETSLQLTGLKKFNEKYYFPYRSASDYLHQRFGAGDDARLKNIGFTKSLQKGADTPLLITGFTQVWAEHTEQMARYAAFALRLDNFARVLNYQPMIETEDGLKKKQNNIRTMLKNTYGAPVMRYISDFLTQMNGGPRSDSIDSMINKMTGKFKRAAVLGNASVVIQQPTAMMRAMAMINPVYFTSFSPGEIGKIQNEGLHLNQLYRDYKNMMEHSAIANVKQMGGFDTDTGRSAVGWIVDEKTFGEMASDILGKGAEVADIVTWTNIWNAVRRETNAKHKDVEYGSEEYYRIVNERFRDIVDYTQVYDSTMSKNAWMRSNAGLARMVTAFMAEPSLSFNLITQSGLKKNGKKINAGFAIGAFVANTLVNAAFKAIVGAWRDKKEDETYQEKWLRRFVADVFGTWQVEINGKKRPVFFLDGSWSPFTMIPFVKDLLSLWQGYSVDRSDVSIFSDLFKGMTAVFDDELWKNEDGSFRVPTIEDLPIFIDFAGAISEMTPVPIQRVLQDIMSLEKLLMEQPGKYMTTTNDTRWRAINEGLGFEVGDAEKAYNAVVNNDTETLKRLLHANEEKLGKVEAKGYTGENISAQAEVELQKKLNSLLAEGLTEFDPEQRVQAAAQARYDRNYALYDELVDSMVDDGFDRNVVLAATEKAWNALHPTEEKKVDEIKDKNAYLYADLTAAIRANDAKAVQYVKDKLLKQGSDQENVEKKVRETVDDMLVEGEIREEDAQRMLVNYAGLSEKEAEAEVDYRIYAGNSAAPDLDKDDWHMYTKTIDGQEYSIRDKGIEPEVFSTYRTESAKCTADVDASGKTISGSKKVKVMAVIDGLPITNEQKDALYFLNGWSKNTLYEAPWH